MSEVQLHLGDCLNFMRGLADKSVDAVITDPPYGIGYQSARRIDTERFDVIEGDNEIPLAWIDWAWHILKDDACLITFCRWDTAEAFRERIISAGFDLRSQVIWNRGNHGLGDLSRQYAPQHDNLWFATKGSWKFPNGRPKSVYTDMRLSGGNLEHPTQKPLSLMEKIVYDLSVSGATVFDPYMGSGTTGVACVQTGRNFIGCEIDPEYFAIAEKRIAEAQLQVRMPI